MQFVGDGRVFNLVILTHCLKGLKVNVFFLLECINQLANAKYDSIPKKQVFCVL